MVNERLVEHLVQFVKYHMMRQSIPHRRLADDPVFGIIDLKFVVWFVFIPFRYQIFMQAKNVILKVPFKLHDILPACLVLAEFLPAGKKITNANYFFILMATMIHTSDIPIIKKLFDIYKVFYQYLSLFPKKDKHMIGTKCEAYLLETLELVIMASSVPREEKLANIQQANVKFDALKLFIRMAHELKILDLKKYVYLQDMIQEIGRMLGGWKKSLAA